MRHEINRPDDRYFNIGVVIHDNIPLAWYTVTKTSSKHRYNAYFWVKHKFRGNGLGLLMLKSLFKDMKKIDKSKRKKTEFVLYDNMWNIWADHCHMFSNKLNEMIAEEYY